MEEILPLEEMDKFDGEYENISEKYDLLLKKECKYIGLYFNDFNLSFVVELHDMKKSLKLVDDMTLKYTCSFNLIIGSDDEVSTLPDLKNKLKLKLQRNPMITKNLIKYLPKCLINIIFTYEY